MSNQGPSQDNFPVTFFKKHWKPVSKGVLTTCFHILNRGGNIAHLNHIYIALIHKIGKPRQVIECRPISLCNVIYKIIAKTIANRLKQNLHDIKSPINSAFIPN